MSAYALIFMTRTRKGNMQRKLPASGARVGKKLPYSIYMVCTSVSLDSDR